MQTFVTIAAFLVGLLSIAAGGAKVALVPDEVAFLQQFGLTNAATIGFGAVQIVGGLLLFVPNTRFVAALVSGLAFSVSAVLLVLAGKLAFAAISLLPVGLAGLIAYCRPDRRTASGKY